MSNKVIMLGNQAIARGAYEAGVKVSSAYPGTPSTEISENLAKFPEVYSEWAPNEKVAVEVAIGASFSGVRSLACMKHVGLNVASDPLYTFSYTGVNGGSVIVVADDPGLASSQNEQDTRMIARSAHIPLIEPSDSGEAKEFIKFAYELSEKYDTPVIFRTTTKLSHSQSIVELDERVVPSDKEYNRDVKKYVMMPASAMGRHIVVEKREEQLAIDGCQFSINKVEMGDKKIGFITSGIAYQYVKEVCPNASILKLGLINPLPKKLIEDFISKVDEIYVFEELEPVIEEQIKSWGYNNIKGKNLFTKQGEYSANLLRKVLFGKDECVFDKKTVPNRPPILCPGCPHRSVFSVLNKLKIHAAGDIGCYTLGAVAPLGVIDTTVCMGASISTLHGMEKAKGKDYIKNWVAVIGDSTFLHTGVNSLINLVYNKSTATVMILDNRTTGMTGHQQHAATGFTLKNEPTYAIDLAQLCKAIGVPRVVEVNSFDTETLEKTIKLCQDDTLSVIIAKAPCALLKGLKFPNLCKSDNEKCKKCGMCLKIGCPAITKNSDGTININQNMCNGCGLCLSYCKFGAIVKEER